MASRTPTRRKRHSSAVATALPAIPSAGSTPRSVIVVRPHPEPRRRIPLREQDGGDRSAAVQAARMGTAAAARSKAAVSRVAAVALLSALLGGSGAVVAADGSFSGVLAAH